eukprot:UN01179
MFHPKIFIWEYQFIMRIYKYTIWLQIFHAS